IETMDVLKMWQCRKFHKQLLPFRMMIMVDS
ncbi:unnamed protein product, partial [Allacma fusca]